MAGSLRTEFMDGDDKLQHHARKAFLTAALPITAAFSSEGWSLLSVWWHGSVPEQ